jgi:hypothetical protein
VKVVIVVLVVIGIIFLAGVGAGLTRGDDGEVSLDNGFATGLGRLLVREERLTASDITSASPAACLQGNNLQIAAGQICTYEIGESQASVRTIVLRRAAGADAEIRLVPRREEALSVKQRLSGAARSDGLDVYTEGATMFVACLPGGGGQVCRLVLE